MAFYETPRFPDNVSVGSSGGPGWRTEIVVSQSGHEQRNIAWEHARHEYDVGYGLKDMEHLEALTDFFLGVRGMAHGFRYKDWADYKSCPIEQTPTSLDQQIGVGDGIRTDFQLIKSYKRILQYDRDITKPVLDTVVVSADGGAAGDHSVDYTTGIVTFTTAPGAGVILTAGYEFDVPCRFATDRLSTQLEVYSVGQTAVPVIEIRL